MANGNPALNIENGGNAIDYGVGDAYRRISAVTFALQRTLPNSLWDMEYKGFLGAQPVTYVPVFPLVNPMRGYDGSFPTDQQPLVDIKSPWTNPKNW